MLFSRLAILAAMAFASSSFAATTIPGGSILVSQSGSGSGSPSNSIAPASVRVFQTNGVEQLTIPIPQGKLRLQGTRGGHLSLSPDGKFASIAGYIPPFSGTGNLYARNDSDAPRGYVIVNVRNGAVSKPTKVEDQSEEAADTVITDSDRAWLAGGNDLVYWNDGKTDVVFDDGTFADQILPNSLRYFGGDLFMTGLRPSYFGFVAAFHGFPHGDSDFPTVIFDVSNPEDLAVIDDGRTIYVARSEGVVNVYHYDKSWALVRQFIAGGSALHGLTVDTSGDKPVVYAIDSQSLWKVTDKGKSAAFRRIAGVRSGYAFTGIVLTPGSGAPQVKLTSPRIFTTTRSVVSIRGTAADADGVRIVQGKRGRNGSYTAARGTTEWRFRATLKPGVNHFFVIAADSAGNKSDPIAVKITRE